MRIAITYENGLVFQHFGHTEQFKIYDVEDNKVISSQIVDTNGNGHYALSCFLSDLKVDVLICGGIGGGAINALNEVGIEIVNGVYGGADVSLEAYLAGQLTFDPNCQCQHHNNDEHECSEHDCGSHSCHKK